MEKEQAKIKPYNRFSRPWWHSPSSSQFSSILSHFCALLGAVMIVVGCSTVKYVPIKGETVVRDSIRYIERVDTVKVQLPPVKVKDYSALGDTLRLSDGYSNAWAAVDAERDMLVGWIETAADAEVDVPVIYKEKLAYKDSVRTVEVPVEVPVEVEKKVVPKFYRIMTILGIVFSTLVLVFAGLKIYGFFKGKPLGIFRKN